MGWIDFLKGFSRGKKVRGLLPEDIEKRAEGILQEEKKGRKKFEELWEETEVQQKVLMKQAKMGRLERREIVKLWEDIQLMEHDAAILLAHDKQFEARKAIYTRKRENIGDSLRLEEESRPYTENMKRLRNMMERDEVKLKEDLEVAKKELGRVAGLIAKIQGSEISRLDLGKKMMEIVADMNVRMNVVRKACGQAEVETEALLKAA